MQAVTSTLEELKSELRLQLVEPASCGRMGQAQTVSGCAQTLAPHDGQEHANVVPIHLVE